MASARLWNLGLLLGPLVLGACVNPFHGSQIEMHMVNGVPADAAPVFPALSPAPTHFELWVTTHDIVAPVFSFKILPPLDFSDPCQIDYFGAQAGLPLLDAAHERETNAHAAGDVTGELGAQREQGRAMRLAASLRAVVSYEPGDQKPPASIGTVTDRTMRLAMCNAWKADHPKYYIGNPVVTALPKNGSLYGFVDGQDPDSSAFIGGFTFITQFRLADAVELFVTVENDDDPGTQGPLYLSGPSQVKNRGVAFFNMASPQAPATQAQASVYSDEDSDNVNF